MPRDARDLKERDGAGMKVTTVLVAAALGTAIGIGSVEMSHLSAGAGARATQPEPAADAASPPPPPPTALADEAEEPGVPPTPAQTQAPARAPTSSPAREGAYQDDFAALNARRPGVVTLPSGVQYEVLEAGSGNKPTPQGSVRVDYQASLPDGRVFDTTADDSEPTVLAISSIAVPGLREALLLMPEGSHWRVVVPPNQGFRHAGNNMLRRRVLIYDIRLLSVEPGN
jgi:FKBP-type peptidyl-prolyl cis-trans isomerase